MRNASVATILVALSSTAAAGQCWDSKCLNDNFFDDMSKACSDAIVAKVPNQFEVVGPKLLQFDMKHTILAGPDQGAYFGGVLIITAQDGTTAYANYMCRYTGGGRSKVENTRIDLIGSKIFYNGAFVSEIE